VLGLLFVGLLIDSTDPRLLGSGALIDVTASPFVLVGEYAGLKGFDSFMNVVILVSVVSIGVSGVYGGSRTLTALAEQGYAPKIFTYIDRSGRPLWSVTAILLCGALGYMNLVSDGQTVFGWLQQLSGMAALFTWGSICLAHIRFRKAWIYHGHTLDEIPFKAAGGVYGSWLGLFIIVIVLIAQVCIERLTIRMLSLNLPSSILPFLRSVSSLDRRLVPPKTSSTFTLPSLSSSSSGSLVMHGNAKAGYALLRWTSTLAAESSTGTTSTLSAPKRLLGPRGSACFTRSSRCFSRCCWVRAAGCGPWRRRCPAYIVI
jgi:amino acid transporter